MPKLNEHEKEARINALTQLLNNSQKDVIAGYEGLIPQALFDELKDSRRAWKEELESLTGTAPGKNEPMTTSIHELIENIEVPPDGMSWPESKYTPEEFVGAMEGLMDTLIGGATDE